MSGLIKLKLEIINLIMLTITAIFLSACNQKSDEHIGGKEMHRHLTEKDERETFEMTAEQKEAVEKMNALLEK